MVPLTLVIIYLLIDATYWEWDRILATDGHFATLKMARIGTRRNVIAAVVLLTTSPRDAW